VPDSALIDKAHLAFANRHRNRRLAYSPFIRHPEGEVDKSGSWLDVNMQMQSEELVR
jgi:hypothetical protein